MTPGRPAPRPARSAVAATLVAAAAIAVPAIAIAADGAAFELHAELAGGHDDNPLRLADDAARSASFVEGELRAELRHRPRPRLELRLDARGTGRRHDDGLADADRSRLELGARIRGMPYRAGDRRLVLSGGVRVRSRDATFVSRSTGEVGQALDAGGQPVPIGERYDYGQLGLTGRVDWRLRASTTLRLDVEHLERDHDRDYESLPDVDPLDRDEWRVAPAIRWHGATGPRVTGALFAAARRYRARRAVDATGSDVDGTRRRYDYRGVELSLNWPVASRWGGGLALTRERRSDEFAGYYDYDGTTIEANLVRRSGTRTRLRVVAFYRDRDYDRATVNDEIGGEILGNRRLSLRAEYRRELGRSLELRAAIRSDDVDNRDPDFAYRRLGSSLALVYRIRRGET